MKLLVVLFLFVIQARATVDVENCRLCHLKKVAIYVPKTHQPSRQHQDFSTKHGTIEISCNNCHDANHSNFLRTSPEFAATFANPSPVCQRCHQDIFKDWNEGIHGKRTGKWNGEKKKLECISCHNPHSVKFKAMVASPPPNRPKLGIEKNAE